MPLVSAKRGKVLELLTTSTLTLHIPSFNLDACPLGIIVIYLI